MGVGQGPNPHVGCLIVTAVARVFIDVDVGLVAVVRIVVGRHGRLVWWASGRTAQQQLICANLVAIVRSQPTWATIWGTIRPVATALGAHG